MAARARARFNEKARGASLGGLLKLEPTPNCIVDVHYNGTRKWQKTTECFPESCHFGDRMRGCEQRRSSERATLSPPAPRRHLKRLLIAMLITFPYRQNIPRGVLYRSGHPMG